MKITKSILLITIYLLFSQVTVFGQYEKEWLQDLSKEDQQQLEAIAMYPEQTRKDILEVTQYPQAIIKLKRIQTQTKAAFVKLLEDYSEQEKKAIWDLTRYPELIEQLAGVTSLKERRTVLADYPKVIYNRAKFIAQEFPDVLVSIASLQQSIQNTIDEVIANYSDQTSSSLQRLIELPEVLTLLSDNLELTMILGYTYMQDTAWVLHQVDSINLELARANAQELEDWKNSVIENSEATDEMEQAAKDFEETYGFDDEYYSGYPDDIYYNETEEYEYVVEHHYYHHYPYWFGYPYWYSYPRWRPFPWWVEWGFYIRPNYGIFVIGLPSHFCINWYFDLGYHHYYYPHFSSHLVHHYYGHRYGHGGITHGVHQWKIQHQHIISENWLSRKTGRAERFKELGKFEKDRLAFNKKHVKNQLTKEEFLNQNQSRYTNLEYQRKTETPKTKIKNIPVPKTKSKAPQKQKVDPKVRTKAENKKLPKTNILKTKKPKQPKISKPKVKPKSRSKVKPTIRKKNNANIPSIKRSKDFHSKSWEKRKRN